ncbi:MAG: transcriptional repressor LexA [Spirochaetia bacterium]|nr:transcriptional repressor LexA [Spirochaetia bacterium]
MKTKSDIPQKMPVENKNLNSKVIYPFKPGGGDLGEFRKKSPRIEESRGKFSMTEKQSTILKFIKQHNAEIGFPPTVREIAIYFNISAKAAHDHLRAVAKKGYIRLFPGSARGIEILPQEEDIPERLDVVMVPLLGVIAAGRPLLAEENIESNIALPASFLPATGDMFALKVKGDSMEKSGIFDGDIAVLKTVTDIHTEVKNGDVVAALIDGEATLKTFIRHRDHIELRPENPLYKPILMTGKLSESIMAKLVGIYRKYNT